MSYSRPRMWQKQQQKRNPEFSISKSSGLTADYMEEAVGQEFLVITAQAIWYKDRNSLDQTVQPFEDEFLIH